MIDTTWLSTKTISLGDFYHVNSGPTELVKLDATEIEGAVAHLAIKGFFSACVSKKYLKESQAEKKKIDFWSFIELNSLRMNEKWDMIIKHSNTWIVFL